VDAVIARTRTAIAKAERLKQGLLQSIFKWANAPLEKLGEAITEIRYGTSQASNDKAWGCPTLRIPNIIGGTISTDDLTCVDASPREMQRYLLKQGDLLLVRTNGNPSYIGRSAIFQPPDERKWLYASYLIRVRFDDRLLPRYVDEYLKSSRGRRELFRRVTTSAGNYNINTKSIRAIPIHVPDPDQQAKVVQIADAANQRIAALEHQRGTLERLKRGLMQDLLTGRVRVKLPASSGNVVVRSRT
jgi:type I restriction enzyme, S subunit